MVCFVGCDLVMIEGTTVQPGRVATLKAGLSVSVPEGHYGLVAPRPFLGLEGVDVRFSNVASTGAASARIGVGINSNALLENRRRLPSPHAHLSPLYSICLHARISRQVGNARR